MDDLIKEFLAESNEGLDRMERCLTELEARPHDRELLSDIFRSVHTIKGTVGFLGFTRLERLAHVGESLLGSLRDGRLVANDEITNGLLQLMDSLREILALIEHTGQEGTGQDQDETLVQLLQRLNRGEAGSPAKPACDGPGAIGTAAPAAEPAAAGEPVAAGSPAGNLTERTLRIDVDVLNRMMNLVGELVLTRNQILQSQPGAHAFPELSRRLDAVTADLRETVMQARMQPVGHLFGKFPRMVRDLARSCGKQVRIEFSGEATGLDKSLLEAIKDPLTHAVRNAVDHGIEDPDRRRAAGKSAEGLIRLTACHQSGSVLIELSDDGGGISEAKVLAKAVERGLITPQGAAEMTSREALQLIFLPGFSTAQAVTRVSGRGVGMDVVRANVEGAGGTVEIESIEGKGTLLRLRVPLTLAIVPALVVTSGDQNFCLPQGALAELVYVPGREAAASIERIGEAELYRLREQLLPIVWLDRLLAIERVRAESAGFYMAVLEGEGFRFGLAVDGLMAPEEIVVKPLSPVLREIGLFSGATVLGNGSLAMILDIAATAARARIRPVTAEVAVSVADREAGDRRAEKNEPSFLVYEDSAPGIALVCERKAVPLAAVERIESLRAGDIEQAAGRLLLQYRGDLLALEDPGGNLAQALATGPETLVTTLICDRAALVGAGVLAPRRGRPPRKRASRVGLVVRRVLDVADGKPLEWSDAAPDETLALVKDRVVVLHQASHTELTENDWQEVA